MRKGDAMHNSLIFLGVVIHTFSVLSLIFIFILLQRSQKFRKSQLTRLFEFTKKEQIFRISFLILAASLFFDGLSTYGAVFHTLNKEIVELFSVMSNVSLLLFLMYLIKSVRYADRSGVHA